MTAETLEGAVGFDNTIEIGRVGEEITETAMKSEASRQYPQRAVSKVLTVFLRKATNTKLLKRK